METNRAAGTLPPARGYETYVDEIPVGGQDAGNRGSPAGPAATCALELLAYWMDTAFEIPGLGIRFGFDAIVGLIPGLGDLITSLISLYILAAARRYGVPRGTLMRMAFNIGVDSVVGAIPFLATPLMFTGRPT